MRIIDKLRKKAAVNRCFRIVFGQGLREELPVEAKNIVSRLGWNDLDTLLLSRGVASREFNDRGGNRLAR